MDDTRNKIVELDLNDVLPNRFQPRIKFNEDSIAELADSIKTHGVLQPILVRPIGDKYEIIAGERRYKACVLAGLSTIPSRIIDYNDKDSAEVALIENVQRRDLTPIEEAISYSKILDMGYLTQEQLASKLGMSQSTIANKKRLLNLCDEVQEALMEEKISERHARSLLKLSNSNEQRAMLKRIIKERLTVRKLDEEINKLLNGEVSIDKEDKISLKEEVSPLKTNEQTAKVETPVIENNEQIDISSKEENNVEEKDDNKLIDDDYIDITNLFNENELDNFLTSISNPNFSDEKINENNINKKKEETGEIDNMMNNLENSNLNLSENDQVSSSGRFFGNSISEDNTKNQLFDFGNSGNVENNSTSKIEDLMAPQGSSSIFQSSNSSSNDSIFSSVPQSLELGDTNQSNSNLESSSMFSNFMNKPSGTAENEYIDGDTFNKFLDPTYVDGSKQETPTNKSVIDSSVFAKFLDPDYGSSSKTESQPTEQTLGASSIFGHQHNNQELIPVGNHLVDEPLVEASNSNENNIMGNLLKPETGNSVDLFQSTSSIFTNPQPTSMMNNTVIAQEELSSTSNPLENQFSSISGVTQSESKPDLLAPMSSEQQNVANIFGENNYNVIPSVDNNLQQSLLTPDDSIFKNDVKEEVQKEVDEVVPKTQEQPVFVMASTPTPNNYMPSTPIIENTDMSKLLSNDSSNTINNTDTSLSDSLKTDNSPLQGNFETNTTIAETSKDDSSIQIPGPIGNQPIIITDYNKQYDPVLPTPTGTVAPTIDLKHIINMIRELSDKIENYGYTIDTEEIDLSDSYQVIFNITKK